MLNNLTSLENSLFPLCVFVYFENCFCPSMQEDTDVEDGENEAQDSDDSEQIIAGGNPHFVLS